MECALWVKSSERLGMSLRMNGNKGNKNIFIKILCPKIALAMLAS